jgi:uncharacterized protein YebE (UPF0316 family)
MEMFSLSSAWVGTGVIFLLRVSDMTLDTLRTLFVIRGRKVVAWVLGFFQALIFVTAIASVLSTLDNTVNLIAYAAGFATGNVIGMLIEERLAVGYTHLRVISSRKGPALADRLRGEGYAVTEIPGRGKEGTVSLIDISVLRRNVLQVSRVVRDVDADAFITAEEVRPLRRGFWRA